MGSSRVTKKKAKHVEVPDLQEDAAERKRVLNILAQRRYRERKRQKLQDLEAKVKLHEVHSVDEDSAASLQIQPELADSPDEVAQIPTTFEHGFNETLISHDFPSTFPSDFPSDFSITNSTSISSGRESFSLHMPECPELTSASQSSESTKSSDSLTFGSPLSTGEDINFPDEILLPVLELNLLRAGMAIAKRLGVDMMIWDLAAISPFCQSVEFSYDHLPPNLRPTFHQLTIQHHPVLDILPWPAVRDRLILIFSQPEQLRPPTARSPTALLDFVYDLEDTAEGVRVTGSDPYAGENWEVGKALFQRWWWALDRKVVDNSNKSRRERGAPVLGGMILGEATDD